jgi:hypothetical protein
MAKEWILNSAMNRFQFNFSRNVGKVSEEIRKCSPKTLEEWKQYYLKNVRKKEHIEELGRRLFIKITEVLPAEIQEATEQDCINYMFEVVIDRTFDGYQTEIQTIYGQLENTLGVKIEPAPDARDRLYNVDFFIKVNTKYISLQIKPASGTSHITQIYQERAQQAVTHKKFSEKYGGGVFYIISVKDGKQKKIQNTEIIQEIKNEIARLKKEK